MSQVRFCRSRYMLSSWWLLSFTFSPPELERFSEPKCVGYTICISFYLWNKPKKCSLSWSAFVWMGMTWHQECKPWVCFRQQNQGELHKEKIGVVGQGENTLIFRQEKRLVLWVERGLGLCLVLSAWYSLCWDKRVRKGVVSSCLPRPFKSEGREMLCGKEGETWGGWSVNRSKMR